MAHDESDRPYQRIAATIRERITSGALRPGDRVPSTRQLVREWGVAMATATRALAVLRDEGLVVTQPGSGSLVRSPAPRAVRPAHRGLSTVQIVATAMALADAEGLPAVSMRRVAGELGVSPMSLYRHVAGREELEQLMVRAAFRASPLPHPGPPGWRAQLELVHRLQWRFHRRHPWLAELLSVTRPPLAPEAMIHSERTVAALEELGLGPAELARETLGLAALVHGLALAAAAELRAERETGVGNDQWWAVLDGDVRAVASRARFPRLAAMDTAALTDLDGVFDHALTRYLDGIAARRPA